jgi:non-ribosomal peptide synthetase component F
MPSPLAPLPIQYADFARWQRRWQSCPDMIAQLNYWREQLHDPLPAMKFGTGRRPEIDDFRTQQLKVALPAELTEAAKSFSRGAGVTLFVTLVATLKILLYRYTGEEDVRVATHVANRNRPQTEGLIGPLVNTLILRTNLGADPSSDEVIRRVRATTLAAFANQDLPFEEVVAAIERERSLDPSALAQVLVWLQNTSLRPTMSSAYGLAFEEIDPSMLTHPAIISAFDIMLMLRESAKGLVGTCVYNPHLFSPETMGRLLQDFQHVLKDIIMQPQRRISAILMPG